MVEQPFSIGFKFSAPPRTQSIMPPPPDPRQTPTKPLGLPQGGPGQSQKAVEGTVLPLGSPAMLVACITALAPCEVHT